MGVTVSAKGSSVKEKEEEGDKMSAQTKVEVTRGVFDPRTYKQVDKENWARKRKPEWMVGSHLLMNKNGCIYSFNCHNLVSKGYLLYFDCQATTGKIHFVRERTVASQERELEEERRAEAAQDEASQELKADLQENPAPVPVKVELAPKKQPVQWVGRKRSDITREGGFMGYFGRTV